MLAKANPDREGRAMLPEKKVATFIAAALTSVVWSSISAGAQPAPIPAYTSEKCYGIAAALQNDCQTVTHSCAGEAEQARDPESWIYVPVGTCMKIAGGSLKRP
jgi:uncharacterized membrane protein